jgi:hypothetical protein
MRFASAPGAAPVFGTESLDLMLIALAIPATLGIFLGMRKDLAVFAAIVAGAAVVLVR